MSSKPVISGVRRGAILIIVAALVAMMAALVLTFIAKNRLDVEEANWMHRTTQARLMVNAALAYIQETSRIGWDTVSGDGINVEAYGWTDVRGGLYDRAKFDSAYAGYNSQQKAWILSQAAVGPRGREDRMRYTKRINEGEPSKPPEQIIANDIENFPGGDGIFDSLYDWDLTENVRGSAAADRPTWPAPGSVAIVPMPVMERPPWAIAAKDQNPIVNDPLDPAFGLPLLIHQDPQPAFGNATTSTSPAADRWNAWRQGDPAIMPQTESKAWFRVCREGPATFIITCGAGASRGYRDWDEVVGLGAGPEFINDPTLFADIVASEVRLWYRVEWSPAIAGNYPIDIDWNSSTPDPQSGGNDWPSLIPDDNNSKDRIPRPWAYTVNQGGSFSFIQRLQSPPPWVIPNAASLLTPEPW